MTVRPALPGDVRAMAAILAANDEAVDWPDLPELGWPYVDYLLARARTMAAEHRSGIAGFGASVAVGRDDVRFLTDLFIDPVRHGQGVGRALLGPLLEGSTERMTFSSADDRALGLYVRAGMRPWWPLLYVDIPAGALGDPEPGLEVVPADVEETAPWSLAWTDLDRSVDFQFYASLPEATGLVVRDGGAVAAVGWARRERLVADGRWLDHASLAPDADPVRATLAILRAAAAHGRLWAPVPGPHPALIGLLERGARIRARDQFCATDPTLIDPVRLLPNPSFR